MNSVQECLILSVIDIQVSNEEQNLKKDDIMAKIMLGETCVDNLNLGSPNASIQDQRTNRKAADFGI